MKKEILSAIQVSVDQTFLSGCANVYVSAVRSGGQCPILLLTLNERHKKPASSAG
jgi:hypothetical protein